MVFVIGTVGGGHGFTSPMTVLWSWASFGFPLAHKGIAPFALYLVLLLGISALTHFLTRQEGRFYFLVPSGIYLWGSVCASFAFRGYEREPLLPYLVLFFLSVLMVIAFTALDWRLAKKARSKHRVSMG